jgi:uncharacterized protein
MNLDKAAPSAMAPLALLTGYLRPYGFSQLIYRSEVSGAISPRTAPVKSTVWSKIASLLVVPKYVLQYESAEDVRTKAPIHFAAHKARWHEFLDQGTLLMIGTFTDLEGSMAVFSTREAAEEFARSDPFVLNGVVSSWRVREWNEAIT